MRRANRILGIIIAVILAGAGVCGILINTGHMPGTDRDVTIWTDAITNRLHDWGSWVTVGGIVGGLIIALAGFLLLRTELRWQGRPNVSELVFAAPDTATPDVTPHDVIGKTRVDGSTLRKALQSDLQNDPRIKHAAVRMTGDVDQPQIDLQIQVHPGTELPAVRSYVAEAMVRFRETSQLEPVAGETVVTVR